MASMSENCCIRFRSYTIKVFLAFFFFLGGGVLVAAHRIDWKGMNAVRTMSGRAVAIDDTPSLLSGATKERECAMRDGRLLSVACVHLEKLSEDGDACQGR
jgi:hypothetical protein